MSQLPSQTKREVCCNNPEETRKLMNMVSLMFSANNAKMEDGLAALVMLLTITVQDRLQPGVSLEAAMKELVDQAIEQARMDKIMKEKGRDDFMYNANFSKGTVN